MKAKPLLVGLLAGLIIGATAALLFTNRYSIKFDKVGAMHVVLRFDRWTGNAEMVPVVP